MEERKRSWSEFVDSVVSVFSPERAARRRLWRQFAARSYRGGSLSRLDSGTPVNAAPDYHLELGYDRQRMVDKARGLERNNPIADAILTRSVENVVHGGIKPQARTASKEWNRECERLWEEEFVPSADIRGLDNFYDLQGLIQRSLKRDGDVGVIKLGNGKLQVVESDQISAPHGKELTKGHRDGIDIDSQGRPLRYYVVSDKIDEQTAAPRRDFAGRKAIQARDFIFLAIRKRIGQTRGVTEFSTTFEHFEHIDGLMEAVVVAARMAACMGLLIKTPAPYSGLPTVTDSAGKTRRNWNLEPGMVKELEPGEEIEQVKPTQPTQDFDSFISSIVRVLGLPFGLPLELLMLDFSKTNYSSARASLLQAYRVFRRDQQRLIDHLCRPVWLWKVERWIEDGRLNPIPDWKSHVWVPPGWAWVDPVKEIEAEQMAVDFGFKNLADVLKEQGKDWVEMFDQRQRENLEANMRGVSLSRSTKTREPFQSPMAPMTQGGSDDDA